MTILTIRAFTIATIWLAMHALNVAPIALAPPILELVTGTVVLGRIDIQDSQTR